MSKIVLTGSAGSGKTTMNKIISTYLPEYKIIDSMSEKFFKKEFFKDIHSDEYLQAQLDIYEFAEREYLENIEYISSRGFSDSYAYLNHSYDVTGKEEYKELIERNFKNQKELLKDDVIHFYFPPEIPLVKKDLRSTNKEFQEETDKNILSFLKETDTEYYDVRGTIEERTERILSVLRFKGVI